ncbi:MAG: DUF1326 domain-containing protein [Gemmataceae bacterium]
MKRSLLALAALLLASVASASEIRGSYVEARTCDVWTGPCFANADFNLGGKNAVMAWNVDKGSIDGVSLDGLSVVAVISAANTLGLEQNAPGKAVLIVDQRATSQQRAALVALVKKQAGDLVKNIVATHAAKVQMTTCPCKENGCVELDAGVAKIKTRCISKEHDKACGNESAFYPPLARGVIARPAAAVEHLYRGAGLDGTYSDYDRRGAYVGTFSIR